MGAERRAWALASVLLFLGALAGAGAVYQHWLPCRGSMLNGSVLSDHPYVSDFSDGCRQAMDSGFGLIGSSSALWSVESLFGTIAVLLLVLAWTSIVAISDWSRTSKNFALLPAIATALTLVLNFDPMADLLGGFGVLLWIAPNLLAVIAFFVVWLEEHPGAVVMLSVALALTASTAVGFVAVYLEYGVMVRFSDANWDAPPGSGYPTVAGVAFLALLLLVVTLVRRDIGTDSPATTPDDRSRSSSTIAAAT